MQEKTSETTQKIDLPDKDEYLTGWGYVLGTPEAEQAWLDKIALNERVAKISNPNRPHGRIYELPSYQSPVTGKWIDGRAARRDDLKRHDCVEYDPSMVTEQKKRHAEEDAQLEKKVDGIVEQEIYSMPTRKREQLVTELENGADVEVKRL